MKKTMKRALSLLLTLAMILSLGVLPASAAGIDEGEEIDAAAYPAQQFSYYEPGGLNIDVKAPAGALPRGTTMEVSRLANLAPVQDAVDRAEDLDGSVVLAADISFWHEGEEVEPVEGNKILVTMTAPEIAEVLDPVVVHVPDEQPAVAERVDPLPNDDEENLMMGDQISFEAEKFSVYAVIGGTGDEARVTVNFYNLSKQAAPIVTVYVKNSDVLLTDGAEREPGKSYINDIVYDPGVGETLESGYLFKGWSMDVNGLTNQPANAAEYLGSAYVAETEGLTIPEIRSFLAELDIKEGDVLNIYAMIYKVFNVTYEDAKGIILASDIVLLPYGQTATSADYTINHDYEVTGNTENFEGWNVISGADKISDASAEAPYPMGTTMKISGDVKFSTEVSKGNWLVFEENLYGATYNAPRFIKSGDNTVAPTAPTCPGYTFAGWYKVKAGVTLTNDNKDDDGNYIISDECFEPFTFGQTLNDYTVVYAKWSITEQTKYTVIVWKQSVTDDKDAADADKTYDYIFSVEVTGVNANTPIADLDVSAYNSLDNGSITVDGEDYSFTGFVFNTTKGAVSRDTKVLPNGTTVVNLYYDRELLTYVFNVPNYLETTSPNWNSGKTYYTEYNGKYYPIVRVNNTSYFHTEIDRSALVQGTTYYIPKNDGSFYTVSYSTSYRAWLIYNNGSAAAYLSDYPSFTVYERHPLTETTYSYTLETGTLDTSKTYWLYYNNNYYELTYYYGSGSSAYWYCGSPINDYWTAAQWRSRGYTIYSRTSTTVTHPIYEMNYEERATFTGLYEQKLSKYGYTWPTDYRWYFSETGSDFDSLEELFTGNHNYYGRDEELGTSVKHYLQNVDGSWSSAPDHTVPTTVWTSHMSFKTFAGFSSNSFRVKLPTGAYYKVVTSVTDNGEGADPRYSYTYRNNGATSYGSNGWTEWLEPGLTVEIIDGDNTHSPIRTGLVPAAPGGIEFRYTRDQYNLTYMVGRFVNRSNEELPAPINGELKRVTGIAYEGSLADYAKNGTKYYDPDESTPGKQTGFVFAGWYIDETCTTEATFDGTMPVNGVIVYGKWQQTEYRVFLKPNVPESDTSLYWGKDDQAMNFRIAYNGKVSMPTGTRTGYEFGGWFTDEAFTHPYNENTRLTDDTVPETPAYDKAKDWTDGMNGETEVPMNKWGNIPSDATPINKDVNRTWITRKLVLYARWSKIIEGADGIGIIYDPNGGTNEPHDTLQYKDNIRAVAQAASTAPSANQTFDCWVMQQWDEAQGKYVDIEGSRIYPGDTFVVLLDNARKVAKDDNTPEHPSYTYTIQLRANYVSKEAPLPTYITWYSNVYDMAGNLIPDAEAKTHTTNPSTADMPYEALTFNTNNGYGFKRTDVQINKGIEIPAPDTFQMDGYTFIGWGRIDIQQNGTRGASGVSDPKDLDESNLFLKWVADNSTAGGHYEAKDPNSRDGAWVPVTQVAADEDNPYQDLYAVWSGEFYVVHTGKDNATTDEVKETYQIKRDNASFNLLASQNRAAESSITSGFLYGGYYLSAENTDGKAYNGSNWTFSQPQTQRADQIHPVGGQTYYIKEVPDAYLRGIVTYTYFMNDSNTVGSIFLVCGIDAAYEQFGVVVGDDMFEGVVLAEGASLTIRPDNMQDEQYLRVYDLSKTAGKYSPYPTSGRVAYVELMNISSGKLDGQHGTQNFLQLLAEGEKANVYWVTADGFRVQGIWQRTYTGLYAGLAAPRTEDTSYTIPEYVG